MISVEDALVASKTLPLWVVILLGVVTPLIALISTIITTKAKAKAGRAEQHAILARQEISTKFDNTVGVVNGHGTLMQQTTLLLQQHGQLVEHVINLKDDFDDHKAESSEYRRKMQKQLSAVQKQVYEHNHHTGEVHVIVTSPEGDQVHEPQQ